MKLPAVIPVLVLSLGPISALAQIGAGNGNAAALAQKSRVCKPNWIG